MSPLFNDMMLLGKCFPMKRGCDYVYAKALKTKIFIFSESSHPHFEYKYQELNVYRIDKSKSALRETLKEKCYYGELDEIILDVLYERLLDDQKQ